MRRLLDYERYREAAKSLETLPHLGRDVFSRETRRGRPRAWRCPRPPIETSLFHLLLAFQEVLRDAPEEFVHEVSQQRMTTQEAMQEILDRFQGLEAGRRSRFAIFSRPSAARPGRRAVHGAPGTYAHPGDQGDADGGVRRDSPRRHGGGGRMTMDRTTLIRAVEAILFVSCEPVPLKSSRSSSRPKASNGRRDPRGAGSAAQGLFRAGHGAHRGGRRLPDAHSPGAWALPGAPGGRRARSKLSQAALETLAIIAYRQPITRAEVEEVRGVDCGAVVRSLLERGLIRVVGKKDVPGRPILYGTTRKFLEVFGLSSLNDLPTLREIEELTAGAEGRGQLLRGLPARSGDSGGQLCRWVTMTLERLQKVLAHRGVASRRAAEEMILPGACA